MRVLLTGAGGFIGGVLRRRLDGHELTATGRRPGPGLSVLDLSDAAAAARLVRECRPQAVVHAGAVSKIEPCEADPEGTAAVNVAATGALARAAAEVGARFYFLTTGQVHAGDSPPYVDDAPGAPLHAYGRQKAQAEGLVLDAGGPALVLRVSLCYGFAQDGAPPNFCDELRAAFRAGRTVRAFSDQRRSMLSVDDAAELVARAVESGLPPDGRRRLNLAGPEPVVRSDFALAFAEAFGFPPALVSVSGSRGMLAAPRPADCSLDGRRLWDWTGFRPKGYRAGVRALVE
ncbi:MAG: SDR family oxidoreductase [Elusimicrobia bacterium]|nr:SDR family oxidoreductase [Elusimicrobiota bacterium]